eukprot:GFUD01037568.1.p1 GENE.GFUD01037568.1~~GFUD01037568.1.p1  ORF type:complete len:663 (+),score=142.17 GFUD01037568.1:118-2106(+)
MNTPGLKAEDTERGHWGSRVEFLLSCVGYSVGLGNVWRFPFLAYENGGGAFLIPYFILLVLVGKPMYFMEAALGQFGQVGPLQIWTEMLPAAVGVGVAMVIISLMVAIYYNVIMAYCLFYLFNSFRSVLPWTECDPLWSDERCYVRGVNTSVGLEDQCIVDDIGGCTELQPQTSEEQFWERRVLDIKEDGLGEFGDLGEFKMELAFYLLVSWIVVLLCVSKGIKSSGKVVYFTATFPYVVLLVLLVMGVTLPGAEQGLYYLFVPKWEKLASFTVWRRAAGQVFFSLGISWGGIIMFGSYNQFTAKVHIDAHIVSLIDFLTSLIASVVIFSTLGHSAHLLGVPVETVAKGGQGLAFVAYPEALSHLPVPHVWSIIFFLMLFLLGLDSEFALFETVTCAVFDTFPCLRKYKFSVTSLMCLVCFLLGLPCVTQCGQYVLDLMDTYGASLSVMIIAVAEMVAIMWVYGVKNFCEDMKSMLGFTPGWYFKACWVLSPVFLVVIFIAACADWHQPSYGSVSYPPWAHTIGWVLTLVSVVQIPIWMLIMLLVSIMEGGFGSWSTFGPTYSWLERRSTADLTFIYKPNLSTQTMVECTMNYDNVGTLPPPYGQIGRPGMDCSTVKRSAPVPPPQEQPKGQQEVCLSAPEMYQEDRSYQYLGEDYDPQEYF